MQDAAREALLKIDISCSVVGKMLDSVLDLVDHQSGSALGKKKKKKRRPPTCKGSVLDVFQQKENGLSFVSSLLDVMLVKKNIRNRSSLLGSLFKLVGKFFVNNGGINGAEDEEAKELIQAVSGVSQIASSTQVYVQQELLLILEDISSSLINDSPLEGATLDQFDMELLVKCARSTKDAVTRNHVFSLFSILAKVIPDKVLDHILDILIVMGESAITQWDGYSRRVFEELVSAVVPFWLSKTRDMEKLIQVFVDVLPQVAQSQRLPIVAHVLSQQQMAVLIRAAIVRAIFLRNMLIVSIQFVSDKLLDPEIAFKIDTGEDSDIIQNLLFEIEWNSMVGLGSDDFTNGDDLYDALGVKDKQLSQAAPISISNS
ncbi:hypothetical protein M9H77_10652 [Catharanthus roseus]|uniref:Uncharacterized protein n=1 Tax=Catharanthus roseus TaxID=4058 RepID=A0ACC0BCE7_CATRO|nr:hypothetical protein M9H77_10652 [Catharanthus roseus]